MDQAQFDREWDEWFNEIDELRDRIEKAVIDVDGSVRRLNRRDDSPPEVPALEALSSNLLSVSAELGKLTITIAKSLDAQKQEMMARIWSDNPVLNTLLKKAAAGFEP